MIWAQRPSHHPDAEHRAALLQGQATKEVCPVDDQKEVTARPTGPGQPPRPQERRRKRGRIYQLIPLRSPRIEVGNVQQAGRSHYRISRRVPAIGEEAHLTPTILPRQDETASRARRANHFVPLPHRWGHGRADAVGRTQRVATILSPSSTWAASPDGLLRRTASGRRSKATSADSASAVGMRT